MKNFWRWSGAIALWWMAVFLFQRIAFLAFSYRALTDVPWADILLCNMKALPMDLSATGYFMLATSLLTVPLLFKDGRWPRRAAAMLSLTFLAFSAIINVTDIGLFEAWGARLDRKAIGYLAFPKEAVAGIRTGWMIALLALAALQVLLFTKWFQRIDHQRSHLTGALSGRIITAVMVPLLCFLAARGGPQDDPINKSWAYFSRYNVLNLAALNGVWNALEIAVEPAQVEENPYVTMPKEDAERIFRQQHPTGRGPARSILKSTRPNLLMVLLESWSADIIEPLGGDSGVAPQFTKLAKDGLLFTNFYSTGFRTEQGLCALLSAFPSQPKTTIIRNFGKFDRLPSLVKTLGAADYSSTYWYAGNVEFANTRAYLEAMGFDRVHDEHSFPINKRTEWGAYDEELFAFHLREAGKGKRPFFHILMTATSHEPFDAPVDEGFPGTNEPQLYRNTIHYTDRCLGDFIDAARSQDWYANTLIVIVADHGHYLPRYRNYSSAARHRIPFLLTGGALRDELRGTTDSTYACHTDFAATLLAQLGLPHDAFEWSRDAFDPGVPHDSFWTFNDGFGIADSTQAVAFDEVGQRVVELSDSAAANDRDRLLRNGKARLQVLLDRYLGFNQ
jgi:phosphoglycerol transferase MdoB-like AlkP superfamily enzyme